MPSSRLGGHAGCRRAHRCHMEAALVRDWAEGLPADALLDILHRLGHIDVMTAADHVCRAWRRAARDEPSLWRRITMRGHEGLAVKLDRYGMACEAVRRSAGQRETFCGEYAGGDGFLIYLREQAPSLKSLRLISCNGVTDEGIIEAVKELPLLEELELSLCENVGPGVYGFVGEVCPQLKRFRLNKQYFDYKEEKNLDKDALGIAKMHGLCSLQLFGNVLTNKGLAAILDNCPYLESLDIRHCFNINMDERQLAKCARIKTMRLSDDPIDDYDLQVRSTVKTVQSPVTTHASPRRWYFNNRYYNRFINLDDFISFPQLSR